MKCTLGFVGVAGPRNGKKLCGGFCSDFDVPRKMSCFVMVTLHDVV